MASSINAEVIRQALRRLELRYLYDEEEGVIVVPLPLPGSDAGMYLVVCQADEAADDIVLSAELCRVPTARRAAVALLLGRLNGRFKCTQFALPEQGRVHVDVCVDLAFASDREALFARSLARLIRVIEKTFDELIRTVSAKGKRRPSLVETQINEVLSRLEEEADDSADAGGV